jgi:hypothetical protein
MLFFGGEILETSGSLKHQKNHAPLVRTKKRGAIWGMRTCCEVGPKHS